MNISQLKTRWQAGVPAEKKTSSAMLDTLSPPAGLNAAAAPFRAINGDPVCKERNA